MISSHNRSISLLLLRIFTIHFSSLVIRSVHSTPMPNLTLKVYSCFILGASVLSWFFRRKLFAWTFKFQDVCTSTEVDQRFSCCFFSWCSYGCWRWCTITSAPSLPNYMPHIPSPHPLRSPHLLTSSSKTQCNRLLSVPKNITNCSHMITQFDILDLVLIYRLCTR